MTELFSSYAPGREPEETPEYWTGYRDAIDDATRAAGMVRLGLIDTKKELTLKQEIVAAIRALVGEFK